jgi:hypothetical protein
MKVLRGESVEGVDVSLRLGFERSMLLVCMGKKKCNPRTDFFYKKY